MGLLLKFHAATNSRRLPLLECLRDARFFACDFTSGSSAITRLLLKSPSSLTIRELIMSATMSAVS